MKKLFFTALVAVVAVGGAFAQTYRNTPVAGQPQTKQFTCEGEDAPTCGSTYSQIYLLDGTPVTPGAAPYLETINYL